MKTSVWRKKPNLKRRWTDPRNWRILIRLERRLDAHAHISIPDPCIRRRSYFLWLSKLTGELIEEATFMIKRKAVVKLKSLRKLCFVLRKVVKKLHTSIATGIIAQSNSARARRRWAYGKDASNQSVGNISSLSITLIEKTTLKSESSSTGIAPVKTKKKKDMSTAAAPDNPRTVHASASSWVQSGE